MATQAEKRAMRKQAANDYRAGMSIEAILEKYDRSYSWLAQACFENGIESILPKYGASLNTFLVLRRLINGADFEEVQQEFGLSRTWVYQIWLRARAAGFDV